MVAVSRVKEAESTVEVKEILTWKVIVVSCSVKNSNVWQLAPEHPEVDLVTLPAGLTKMAS